MNYIMSQHQPDLLSWDIKYGDDLLQGVPDTMRYDDDAPPRQTSDGDRWPLHVAESLGFLVEDCFPVNWDGSGCHILRRLDNIKGDLPAQRFQYLALLDVCYEDGIVVAIPDAAALLQFYRLAHPMLALQIDERFGWESSDNGRWQRGKSTLHFYKRAVREYQKKYPSWRPGQPRPKKMVPDTTKQPNPQ